MKTQLNAIGEFIFERSKLKTQLFLLLCSVICAHLILASTYDDKNTLQIMNIPGYTYSLVLNSLIVLLVAEVMCGMVQAAHRRYPVLLFPKKHFYHRLKYSYGVSVVLAIILAGIYFKVHGQNIFSNGFFHGTFITDLFLIFIGNTVLDIYFFGQFFLARDPAYDHTEELPEIDETEETSGQENSDTEEQASDDIKTTVEKKSSEPLKFKTDPGLSLIMNENRKPKAFDKEGQPVKWNISIKRSKDLLPYTYTSTDQSHIINNDAVQEAWWSKRHQAVFVKLKIYQMTLRVAEGTPTVDFKNWCGDLGIKINSYNSRDI